MSLRKILICPYFGDFPPWWDKYEWPEGYDYILDTDLEGFKKRVKDKLGIDYPGTYGSCKVWDYRCALGLLYEEELKGYDYWLTCDFDVVFGDVNKFFPDEEIIKWDVWSNHDSYVCGFWSLYKNDPIINSRFMGHPKWKEILEDINIHGWVETEYSRLIERTGVKFKYSGDLQGDPYHPPFNLKKEDGKLFQDGIEIPMLHFRRSKIWPL